MKKLLFISIALLLITTVFLVSCKESATTSEETTDFTVVMNMNTDYPLPDSPKDGKGSPAKVIVLLGQSNATGCSIVKYLKDNIAAEKFAEYENGYPSVLINYCLDDHNATSNGAFVKVDLTCGAADGFFGPEVGIAEVLSEAYPDETIFILKYTMSGYSLHHNWLRAGDRGSIYDAAMAFITRYMTYLADKNYQAKIGAILWMQGESDTTDFKASHYYNNQSAFVSYLREDLAPYAEDGGIAFIDAGISNSPYCEPAYPAINEAKRRFASDSPLNYYFPTIENGLTVHLEPPGDPDWGHYDSLSGIALGKLFGNAVVESYRDREKTQ